MFSTHHHDLTDWMYFCKRTQYAKHLRYQYAIYHCEGAEKLSRINVNRNTKKENKMQWP